MHQALRIDLRQNLLLLGEHLLLHAGGLLGCHSLHLLLGGHAWDHGWASLVLHVVAVAASLSHVVAAATGTTAVALEIATTLTIVLAVVLISLALVALALLAVTAHLAAIRSATVLATLASHAVKILHEVLLHFVETTLLALLVQLLGRHPELNREGSGAEGGRLIETLNGTLGAFDVFVEDEILSVSCLRVEVFALSQFNRNDGSDFFEKGFELLFSDFRRNVLHEQV